jgi:tetratricopeptide (TPR) repeat protein
MRYYQARSLEKLGEEQKAAQIYQALLKSGAEGMKETSTVDYFAKFGERQSRRARLANAHFTLGLGYLGTNDRVKAKQEFAQALEQSPDHLAAKTNLSTLD